MSQDSPAGAPSAFGCRAGTGQCELNTITASQLSATVILSIYLLVSICSAAVAKTADAIAIQTTIASMATVFYIFLCILRIEDQLIIELRTLKRFARRGEFGSRVLLLGALALMPSLVGTWIPHLLSTTWIPGVIGPDWIPKALRNGDAADRIVVYLALLYLVFLCWDGILYFGASDEQAHRTAVRKIAVEYFKTDIVGFFILISVEIFRFVDTRIASVILVGFIVLSAVQIYNVYKKWKIRFRSGFGRMAWR
jgi:hypothetical protein